MINRGLDPSQRRAILLEKLKACKALRTKHTAAFDGEYVKFTESRTYRKPVQKPYRPSHLGAPASDFAFSQIAEWADGWLPVLAFAKDEMPTSVATMRVGGWRKPDATRNRSRWKSERRRFETRPIIRLNV